MAEAPSNLKSVMKLNKHNYREWSKSIGIYLLVNNGYEYVTMKVDPSNLNDAQRRDFFSAAFVICESIAQPLRYLVHQHDSDLKAINPYEIWQHLHNHFALETMK